MLISHIKKILMLLEKIKIIKCTEKGPNGSIKIHEVTHDVEVAMKNPELIISVSPSFAHEDIARTIAPYVKKGDKIFLSPGSTGGALVFAKVLQEFGKMEGVKLAEVHTLEYSS